MVTVVDEKGMKKVDGVVYSSLGGKMISVKNGKAVSTVDRKVVMLVGVRK